MKTRFVQKLTKNSFTYKQYMFTSLDIDILVVFDSYTPPRLQKTQEVHFYPLLTALVEISICSSHRVLDYDARGPAIEFHRGHYILHRLNMFYCCSKLYMVFLNAGDIYNYIYIYIMGKKMQVAKIIFMTKLFCVNSFYFAVYQFSLLL